MYYGWSKEFLEAGKRRLAGDTARAATSDEVKELRREAQALKIAPSTNIKAFARAVCAYRKNRLARTFISEGGFEVVEGNRCQLRFLACVRLRGHSSSSQNVL
jgi:hypothetical protein